MPTSTVEDYLKCIYHEQERSRSSRVSTGQIASSLAVAPGTATAMVKTLADSGLISYEPYAGVRLTAAGEQLAAHVLRRHRLLELFLVRVLGMDWAEVHREAEVLEHAVSERLVERIDAMLGRPSVDPHGDPIPDPGGQIVEAELHTLLACPVDRRVRIARVTDQSEEFLRLLERHQLVPGRVLQVCARDAIADTIEVEPDGAARVQLGFRAASKVLVEGG